MTRTRLAVLCAIGAAMWGVIFWLLSLAGIGLDLPLVGRVVAALLLLLILSLAVADARGEAEYDRQERESAVRDRVERQRRLLASADRIEAAPPHEQERLYREAQGIQDWDDAA